MKNLLIDISGKLSKSYIDAITEIKKIADLLGIPFFIIGALARDLILEYFYGIKSPRMTMDIDLGVKVLSWQHYNDLVNALVESGKFKEQKENHRLQYNDVFIDIIPFGKISDKDFKISWPPEHELVMNVMGFDEVYEYSTIIRLSNNPILEVIIPTLPGLAILKLLSWKDNYPGRPKDAEDLFFIMINYEHADIFDRLYNTEIKLLENENFDNRIAGIKLLGKDIRKICNGNTLTHIKEILAEETDEKSNYNLVINMMKSHNKFDEILNLLIKLKDGIFEIL